MKKLAIHLSYHLALLFVLPITFISIYVWIYSNPLITINQHLSVITVIIFSVFSFKLLINHYYSNQKLIFILGAIIYSTLFLGMIFYYLLVLISLHSWNKVITWEFISSYAYQAEFFFEALNISYNLLIAIVITTYILLTITCYHFLKKFHWLPKKNPNNTWLIGPLLLSILLFLIYQIWSYTETKDDSSKEPVKLTLFSGKPKLQSHNAKIGYGPNDKINTLEDAARKNYHAQPSTRKRNVIVFLVDGLRPDHTGLYGYQRENTPYLKKISQENSKLFTEVRTICGETSCAHAGYMGSRFIHQLPDNLFTFQEVLKLNGYHTNFIISGNHVNFYNIRDIYGNVDEYYDGSMQKKYYFNDDTIIVNRTKTLPEWNGKPTLIHYHLLSAHQVGQRDPQYLKYTPSESYIHRRSGLPTPKFTNFYDNGVLQTDAVIKQLLDILGTKKYLENTLILVMADHGEALGEHNVFMHTNSVIEEALRIPLMVKSYGYKSELLLQKDDFISITDLSPTLLYELGLNIPDTWTGNPIQLDKKMDFSFFEMPPYKGIYDHRDPNILWKYWQNTNTGEEFAYNITYDPKENNNLIWKVPTELKRTWRGKVDKITLPAS